MHSQLYLCQLIRSESLSQSLSELLDRDRHWVVELNSAAEFCHYVEQYKQHIDCLILQDEVKSLLPVINQLYETGTLLPVVIFLEETTAPAHPHKGNNLLEESPSYLYHSGEVQLNLLEAEKITAAIGQAIAQFLKLAPSCRLTDQLTTVDPITELATQNFLLLQQRRLADKLKERLGYLGLYYKRNPQHFFRYLSAAEKQDLIEQLRVQYRQIILSYFSDDPNLNQLIDELVTSAFFADLPVSQIVEIHMELIDEFSKQLKLEGRGEEILLDYRLTLIDVIAHLCEMYRRSIPRDS